MGKKVGKLIKAARTAADLTQEKLARKVGGGCTANDISLAERGEKDLTQAQLKKIATATGVTQSSLIEAAKSESKTTTKKTTTTKAKTPSNANTSMKVTSTEKKLIELYRLADSDAKKAAMNALKGESGGLLEGILGNVDVEDVIEDVIGGLLGNK
ncbi:MAG: helix-turn-helix transcriptional regulator [Clostridia bacterium]|nr:helix-turn-helix transcriptional regulator [Clostridia bacterium]